MSLIIALSLVLDALRDVFPISKRYKAASEHTIALESLFIDAQLEWESIFAGKYTDEQVSKRLHLLRTLHHKAEIHSFRDGLPTRDDLFKLAQDEGENFLSKHLRSRLIEWKKRRWQTQLWNERERTTA